MRLLGQAVSKAARSQGERKDLNPFASPATSSPGLASNLPQRLFSQSSDDLLGKAGPGGKAFSSIQARGMKPEN